ncbi:hypothetical protein C9374_004530 [Naegleria lovaniensis]|uniref:UNC93-like protein MFSD11 n=1 Tax=Naegleria lovaniensis TaxID=51637 RepID=A0AA88KKN1_NAELO|nr:uncharacterized protein C9374_004530 [Naegleria lovaniensis]KAG2383193.1 hypothetical protein C9374_004530 [Naegleria lovaniensis]
MHDFVHQPGDSTANAPAQSIMKMHSTEHKVFNDSSDGSYEEQHSVDASYYSNNISLSNGENGAEQPASSEEFKSSSSKSPFILFPLISKLSKCTLVDKGLFNVFNLGFSFFLLFCSYETTQNFLTTIREEEGFIALFVLYTAFAFASFVSPSFCTLVGEKITVIIGSSGYILFVFSAAIESSALLYLTAAYNGFCAALLWTSQGSLLTLSANYSQVINRKQVETTTTTTEIGLTSKEFELETIEKGDSSNIINISHSIPGDADMVEIKINNDEIASPIQPNKTDNNAKEQSSHNVTRSVELMGIYSGIFFGIYQLNFIAGNLLAGSLISAGFSNFSIFFILGCLCVIGMLSLFTLRSMKPYSLVPNINQTDTSSSTEERTSEVSSIQKRMDFVRKQGVEFLKLVKGSIFVLLSKKMLIFSLISIYSGFSASFFYGSLPPIIGKSRIGWVMIVFGVSQVLCALISGKLNDFIGRRASMVMSMVIHALGIALSFQMVYWGQYAKHKEISTEIYLLFFATMGVFGGADAFLMNSIYSILGSRNYYKKKHTSEAFSAFRFVQSISTAVGFAFGIILQIVTIQFLLVVSFVMCIIAFLILDGFIASVDKEKRTRQRQKSTKAAPTTEHAVHPALEI